MPLCNRSGVLINDPLLLKLADDLNWLSIAGSSIRFRAGAKGSALWNIFREAGKPHGIGPGNPSFCESVKCGLLSYGGDTDSKTNPFEVRLGKYIDLDMNDDVVGIGALRRIKAEGTKRHRLGVMLDGDSPTQPGFLWREIRKNGRKVGDITCLVVAPEAQHRLCDGAGAGEIRAASLAIGLIGSKASVQDSLYLTVVVSPDVV